VAFSTATADVSPYTETSKTITDPATGEKLIVTTTEYTDSNAKIVSTTYGKGKLKGKRQKEELFASDKKYRETYEYFYNDKGGLAQTVHWRSDGVKSVSTFHTKGKLKGKINIHERYKNGKLLERETCNYDKKGHRVRLLFPEFSEKPNSATNAIDVLIERFLGKKSETTKTITDPATSEKLDVKIVEYNGGSTSVSSKFISTSYAEGKLKGKIKTYETYKNGKLVNTTTYIYNKKGKLARTIVTPKPTKSLKKSKPADTSYSLDTAVSPSARKKLASLHSGASDPQGRCYNETLALHSMAHSNLAPAILNSNS